MDAIETKLNTPPADNPGADALEAIEKEIAELHEQITNLKSAKKQYVGLCHSSMQEFLQSMAATNPNITPESVEWDRFPDGTDKIALPILKTSLDALEDRHVLFVASFHTNEACLSQLHLLVYLCELRIASLTILLPFFPTGTTERVAKGEEDIIPTANTLAHMLSTLPSIGPPVKIVTYDIHALPEQFYFSRNAVCRLRTAVPLMIKQLQSEQYTIAFPDDGAKKRFAGFFKEAGFANIVTCGKTRKDNTAEVIIQDGDVIGRKVLIVDDQSKSGGTLFECAKALRFANALEVSAFIIHGAFIPDFVSNYNAFLTRPPDTVHWFRHIYVTNSVPTVTDMVASIDIKTHRSKFQILDLAPLAAEELS